MCLAGQPLTEGTIPMPGGSKFAPLSVGCASVLRIASREVAQKAMKLDKQGFIRGNYQNMRTLGFHTR